MFYQESFIAQFYSPQFINDFLVWATLSKEGYTLSCFKNHQTNIVVNESEKAFITSRDGYSFIQSNGIECILIPFDPYIALLLAPPEYEKKHEIITLPCDADVMYINEQILSNENEYNSDFIISTDKEELERLRDYLANKK